MIFNIGGAMDVSARRLPKFRIVANGQTFENAGEVKSEPGVYELIQTDAAKNHWYLKLLCSCSFTPLSKYPAVEAYVLGGGGGGQNSIVANGGGGGKSTESATALRKGAEVTVTVGAGGASGKDGGASAFGNINAAGGKTGDGGSATGYSHTLSPPVTDGGDGEDGTYPFGDALAGQRYGAGGGGTHGYYSDRGWSFYGREGHGGNDGGGNAGKPYHGWTGATSYPDIANQSAGEAATDYGGGGGGGQPGGAGYQGIVILRNKR